jgi:hypothetical protein
MKECDAVSFDGALDLTEVMAVQRLLADYARHADDREVDAWTALFATDGVLVVFGKELSGQERLTRFLLRSPNGVHIQSVPHLSRGAHGTFVVRSSFLFANGETRDVMAGWYLDTMITAKTGEMLFARREIDLRVGPQN